MAWPSSPFGGQSVTHVSGTFCYLCLGTVIKQNNGTSVNSERRPFGSHRHLERSVSLPRQPLHSIIYGHLRLSGTPRKSLKKLAIPLWFVFRFSLRVADLRFSNSHVARIVRSETAPRRSNFNNYGKTRLVKWRVPAHPRELRQQIRCHKNAERTKSIFCES